MPVVTLAAEENHTPIRRFVSFDIIIGYDDIHTPRVTLWYNAPIWQQKEF